jgi:hypothetical protein
MLKLIFIPLTVSILSMFTFLSTDVTTTLNIPTSANAGNEFLVEVTINKGNIEGFARFQQELPVGFTATARQSANGSFKFEDQKVKIQWMQIPYDNEIKITYNVEVAPTVSGDFDLAGKFSFIADNVVQTATISPKTINIIGDETAAGTAQSAITSVSYQNVSLKNIDCIRQKPYLTDNNEVIVNLMVNKGDLTGFGKIQEQIPRGYRVESLRSKNSIFTFKNSIIKFLWMNMPSDPQFVVSYKLIPEGEIPDQAFLITGTFSYAENERTKTINIADREVDLDNFNGDELVVQKTTPPTTTAVATTTTGTTVAIAENNTSKDIAENTQNNNKQSSISDNTTPNYQETEEEPTDNYNKDIADITNIPSPAKDGVSYRVQIAAGHNLVNNKYFKKLNITDNVQVEIHNGWHKYTVGNFPIYKEARNYRVYIWNNSPIHDAFVAAYNNGLRITVQEALMIANQKWYK